MNTSAVNCRRYSVLLMKNQLKLKLTKLHVPFEFNEFVFFLFILMWTASGLDLDSDSDSDILTLIVHLVALFLLHSSVSLIWVENVVDSSIRCTLFNWLVIWMLSQHSLTMNINTFAIFALFSFFFNFLLFSFLLRQKKSSGRCLCLSTWVNV